MPLPMPPGGGQGPVQGLQAAKPSPSAAAPQSGGAGGKGHLVQAAVQLVQQAVTQFGPEIVPILLQLLQSATGGAGGAGASGGQGPGAGAPPPGPAGPRGTGL